MCSATYMGNLERIHNLTIGYQNIQGLHNQNGCKLTHLTQNLKDDIEIWSETWACKCEISAEGYEVLAKVEPHKKLGVKKGRKSGGIIILVKKYLFKQMKVLKKSDHFIWLELDRRVIKNY